MQRQDVPPKKYITINGVTKLNPAYAKFNPSEKQTTVANPEQALTIVSTMDDYIQASEAHKVATGKEMKLSESTVASIEMLQDPEHLGKFKAPTTLDGGVLLDKLTNIFAQYEIPLGMVNKLLALSEYNLNFIIDDSGSMNSASDVSFKDATAYLAKRNSDTTARLTRWQEAEDRLHIMIDLLAFIPTNGITLRFLNRDRPICLNQQGKTPEKFAEEAHAVITQAFSKKPVGLTPIFHHLEQAFNSEGCNMHYLFTDGVPTDASTEAVAHLIKMRRNPMNQALTFISCTDDNAAANWMREIEEIAPYTSEIDDFFEERKEVNNDQGPGFPYTKGFWLLCQLVSAINPHDLDALDESAPLCKQTMDNFMGRILPEMEYRELYFRKNPNAKNYTHIYDRLVREYLTPQQIKTLEKPSSGFSLSHPHASLSHMFSSFKSGKQPKEQKQNNLNAYPPYRPY